MKKSRFATGVLLVFTLIAFTSEAGGLEDRKDRKQTPSAFSFFKFPNLQEKIINDKGTIDLK